MEHQSNKPLKIHESCKIGPPREAELSEPLTFFDILWFKLHPSERLYFYSLPHTHSNHSHTNSFFFDTLIPKMKRSLSLTLNHFLPLAGKVVWPSNSHKPFLLYSPGDGVSLVLAETDADFNHLSGNGAREASEFRPLVPSLETTDSFASVLALQVTLFPNVGICIGLSSHHAVLDGKSTTMFMKAWAHLCQTAQEPPCLSPELDPFLDRTIIKDPNGLDIMYLNGWKFMSEAVGSHERSLKLLPNTTSPQCLNSLALATFELSPQDLQKLKQRVFSLWDKVHHEEEPTNLSTFVLASAFAFTCTAKAITGNDEGLSNNNNITDISFGFSADCRSRLNPQLDPNYLGNCVFPCMINTVTEEIVNEEEGIVIMAKKIQNEIRRFLEKGVLDEAEALISKWKSMASRGTRAIGIGGFTRFGVYKTDFGWGKPVKVEIATVDINGLITMAEGREGNGGVELGLLLYKNELDLFASSFRDAIQGLY